LASNAELTWYGSRVSLPHVLDESSAFVDPSWADDKNNRRSSMAYYLFLNHANFLCGATLSEMIALSTAEAKKAELMAVTSGCCEIV